MSGPERRARRFTAEVGARWGSRPGDTVPPARASPYVQQQRQRLAQQHRDVMRALLFGCPFPSRHAKESICERLGLGMQQVTSFMINERKRNPELKDALATVRSRAPLGVPRVDPEQEARMVEDALSWCAMPSSPPPLPPPAGEVSLLGPQDGAFLGAEEGGLLGLQEREGGGAHSFAPLRPACSPSEGVLGGLGWEPGSAVPEEDISCIWV